MRTKQLLFVMSLSLAADWGAFNRTLYALAGTEGGIHLLRLSSTFASVVVAKE